MSSTSSTLSGVESPTAIDLDVLGQVEEKKPVERRDSSPLFGRSYEKWSPMEQGATLVWRELSVLAKTGKEDVGPGFKSIISGGAVKPGSLVALMGPSGAGKSTLMAALAHRTSGNMAVDGEILINGRPIGDYMRHLSAFMHQEDLFVESMTVLEHMRFNARMKLDRRTPAEEVEARIVGLLNELGLGHLLNAKIGSVDSGKVLSGGEKKRLAFATELLTDPQILFCDEPTTGLDSYSAQKIVSMLNKMAINGKTVVCTIHQPSSQVFAMFSQIILLAEGRITFMGSTACAIDFFAKMGYKCPPNYNPADFFMRTLAMTPGHEETNRQTVKKISNNFAISDYVKEIDVLVQYEFHMCSASEIIHFETRRNFKEIHCWTKFALLTNRYFMDILRNPSIQILRILQKIVIALMVGLCYFETLPLTQNGIQSLQGALNIIVCENTFPAMYSVLAEFPNNIPLFVREYRSGMYSPVTFYLAKICAMIPGLILEPFLFATIVYWLVGLKNTVASFSYTVLSAVLIMNIASACGVFFSNAFNSVSTAMLCLIPCDYVLMITSGVFVNLNSLGNLVSWTMYLSWFRYGMEALTIVQWSDVRNITCETTNPSIPCLTNGDEVIDKYSFAKEDFAWDYYAMVIQCLVFYFFGFLFLLRKLNRNY